MQCHVFQMSTWLTVFIIVNIKYGHYFKPAIKPRPLHLAQFSCLIHKYTKHKCAAFNLPLEGVLNPNETEGWEGNDSFCKSFISQHNFCTVLTLTATYRWDNMAHIYKEESIQNTVRQSTWGKGYKPERHWMKSEPDLNWFTLLHNQQYAEHISSRKTRRTGTLGTPDMRIEQRVHRDYVWTEGVHGLNNVSYKFWTFMCEMSGV